MMGEIVFTDFLVEPVLYERTVYIIAVNPAFAARIIRWVNANDLTLPAYIGNRAFKATKLSPSIMRLPLTSQAESAVLKLPQGCDKTWRGVIPDDIFPFKLQGWHEIFFSF